MTDKKDAQKLEFHGCLTPDEVSDQLTRLAEGIRTRSLLVETANNSVALAVASDVDLTVELKSGTEKSKVSIELLWRSDLSQSAGVRPSLHIGPPADTAEIYAEGFGIDHMKDGDRRNEPAASVDVPSDAVAQTETTHRRRAGKSRARTAKSSVAKPRTRTKAASPHRSKTRKTARAR